MNKEFNAGEIIDIKDCLSLQGTKYFIGGADELIKTADRLEEMGYTQTSVDDKDHMSVEKCYFYASGFESDDDLISVLDTHSDIVILGKVVELESRPVCPKQLKPKKDILYKIDHIFRCQSSAITIIKIN